MRKILKTGFLIIGLVLGVTIYINYTLSDEISLTGNEFYDYTETPYKMNVNIQQEVKDANTTTVGIDGTTQDASNGQPIDTENYSVHDRAKPYWSIVVKYSKEQKIDPVWFASMITNESTWDPNCTSSADARGLCQIEVPHGTWGKWGQGDPYDPEQNIKAGTALFNYNLDRAAHYGYTDRESKGATGEQYHNALLIYGAGEGNYQKGNIGEASQAYANELKYYKAYINGSRPIGDKW